MNNQIVLSENKFNSLLELGLKYLINSNDHIDQLENIIEDLSLGKSSYSLLNRYCEKALYNKKLNVNKKEFMELRNKISSKMK